MIQKLKYLLRSVINSFQKKACPYCGNKKFKRIDGKYLFTQLLKCDNCSLSHRHPKDDPNWLRKFYQKEYSIDTHMMTKLPEAQNLQELKEQNFANLKDYDKFIKPLKNESCKLIDYGCSWGYNVFKLRNSGHDAVGFELSKPRAKFGSDNLGVQIFTSQNDLPGGMDLIFSSHVIEHLTDIKSFVSLSRELLNQDGLFMAFCPNGSEEYRSREPKIWHVNWGFLHPNFLNIEFAQFIFKNNPYLILTGDWDYDVKTLNEWDQKSQVVGNGNGKELLIIAKPNIVL